MSISVIILAAGRGKRMGSNEAKVLVKACNRPLVSYVIETASKISPIETIIVTGFQKEAVQDFIISDIKERNLNLNVTFAFQEELLGTGSAVMYALKYMKTKPEMSIILCGDVPFIKASTIQKLIESYKKENSTVNVLTFDADITSSYGRIIRDKKGNFLKIVEAKDCTEEELKVSESNSGVYCVNTEFLKDAVTKIKQNNAQQEYYITDIVEIAVKEGKKVLASKLSTEDELQGVNSPLDLKKIELILNG